MFILFIIINKYRFFPCFRYLCLDGPNLSFKTPQLTVKFQSLFFSFLDLGGSGLGLHRWRCQTNWAQVE